METLCQECQNKMGVWGIPGTFPTMKVLLYIDEVYDPGQKLGFNASIVNELYKWYLKGIESGLPYYEPPDNTKIGLFVHEHSGYQKQLVFTFLGALYEMGSSGKINNDWWKGTGVSSGVIPSFPDVPDVIKDPLKNTVTLLKWTAGIAIGAGVLYFTWPLLTKARKKISK